jgi:hypothetical protein
MRGGGGIAARKRCDGRSSSLATICEGIGGAGVVGVSWALFGGSVVGSGGSGVAARSASSLGGEGTVTRLSVAFASQTRSISVCSVGWGLLPVSVGAGGFMPAPGG